jgi:hypothetical protein
LTFLLGFIGMIVIINKLPEVKYNKEEKKIIEVFNIQNNFDQFDPTGSVGKVNLAENNLNL